MTTLLFKTRYEHFPSEKPHHLTYDADLCSLVLTVWISTTPMQFCIEDRELNDADQLITLKEEQIKLIEAQLVQK